MSGCGESRALYLARDFVETREGLCFAVVDNGIEGGRVPAFLRYVRVDGRLRKTPSDEARRLIAESFPEYLFHSALRDVDLHGIPPARVSRHHQPRARAGEIAAADAPDVLEAKAGRAMAWLAGTGVGMDRLGVTGSLLLGAHTGRSDIDLVVYDRAAFAKIREAIRIGFASGELEPFSQSLWQEMFRRRGCSLSLDEYIWHEQRKSNKLVVGGTRIDISFVPPEVPVPLGWRKLGRVEIRADVVDDRGAFDYPARFVIRHPRIGEVVSYTATFTGQARRGERILARGWEERSDPGDVRVLVGTSREAEGELIRVVGD